MHALCIISLKVLRGPICPANLWLNHLADTHFVCLFSHCSCYSTCGPNYLFPWFLPRHTAPSPFSLRLYNSTVVFIYIHVFFFCMFMRDYVCTAVLMSGSKWKLFGECECVCVCVCKCELAYRCEDKHSSLCSTFSCFLARLFNEADILLKWRRGRRMHPVPLVMWSDPRWAGIKVEWVCFLFVSDVLLSQSLPLKRNLPCCANTRD